jgi:hypothetical protein
LLRRSPVESLPSEPPQDHAVGLDALIIAHKHPQAPSANAQRSVTGYPSQRRVHRGQAVEVI